MLKWFTHLSLKFTENVGFVEVGIEGRGRQAKHVYQDVRIINKVIRRRRWLLYCFV